ncbi:MAG: terminase family protein [Armatimonadia bacterium]
MLIQAVDDDRSVLQRWIDDLGAETFQKLWRSFPVEVREAYAYDWSKIARPKQLPPPGDWLLWMLRAGRGFGKTRCGAEWIRMGVESGACGRVALIGPTAADTRDVMVEGTSGILAISPNNWRPQYEPSKRRLTWPNGAVGTLYSAEEPDRLRGPQHDRAWADELAAWSQLEETWDMLQFGLRLGNHPQALITTTPRGLPILRKLEADPTTVVTRGNTYENAGNLAPSFLAAIKKKYEGTRLGRQEIDAEILDDNPGALWKRAMIDPHRVEHAPQLSRIIVPWDPAVTADASSDEHGILAIGAGMCSCKGEPELHGFVLEDGSAILTPSESCDRVASIYQRRMANGVIGETNQGGDFIEALLRANPKSKGLTYRGVHAKDGKRLRAEPVVALYEQGKVHHVGIFPKMEDEMTQWDPMNQVESPNRVDALVHGLTELLVHPAPPSYSSSRGSGPKFRV